MKYAGVTVNINSSKQYIYSIPDKWSNQLREGSIVTVMFRGRKRLAMVREFRTRKDISGIKGIKDIDSLHIETPVSATYIEFIDWVSSYYFSSKGNILRLLLPALKKHIRRYTGVGLDGLMPKSRINKALNPRNADSLIEEGNIYEDIRPYRKPVGRDIVLNDEQQAAVDSVKASIDKTEFRGMLLYGPPASGKTEVYIEAIEYLMKNTQKNAMILLPEIGLAQFVFEKVCSVFGSRITGLYHSELSDGERYFLTETFIEGRKRILVGTRSSLFVPVNNIGLIVVDEEQDMSYKQTDSVPYYNARDCAVYLGNMHNAPVLLVSATPSLESYYNAKTGKYCMMALKKAYNDSGKPAVSVHSSEMHNILPVNIVDSIADNIKAGKQTMVFINRRGYLNLYKCSKCNEYFSCTDCSVSMSFHKKDNVFKCHYCGKEQPADAKCPVCGGTLRSTGVWGTQKIEDMLARLFPAARIERMDIDTSMRREARKYIIDSMLSGKTDILTGTQMISKGYDIPAVHTVIIMNADNALHMPDFRSQERFMQLLVQTAGRAGRRNERGNVIIVGSFDKYANEQISKLDYSAFIEDEMKRREILQYPPFRRICRLSVKHRDRSKAIQIASDIYNQLQGRRMPENTDIHVPVPAIVEKVGRVYRYNIFILYKSSGKLRKMLAKLSEQRNDFTIDIDTY